jgi:hypothetical protein
MNGSTFVGLLTDAQGSPIVQGPTDPAPGFFICPTSLRDPARPRSDPRAYVDSETVPYVVLPSGRMQRAGIRLGDISAVYNVANGRLAFAIVADLGPRTKFGEGSIALARELGIRSDVRTGGTDKGIIYLTFPGSGQGTPLSADQIHRIGSGKFAEWGGMTTLKAAISTQSLNPGSKKTP